jgi:hypothetical protein
MLLATGLRINRALVGGGDYAVVRFAIFIATLVANFSETNFAWMTPLGFLFLLVAIGDARPERAVHGIGETLTNAPAARPFDAEADEPAESPARSR